MSLFEVQTILKNNYNKAATVFMRQLSYDAINDSESYSCQSTCFCGDSTYIAIIVALTFDRGQLANIAVTCFCSSTYQRCTPPFFQTPDPPLGKYFSEIQTVIFQGSDYSMTINNYSYET